MLTEKYTTGTGQKLTVHSLADCKFEPCVIHSPSDHCMRHFPTHWRDDRRLMERMCPHGVGHPDPDDLAYKKVFMSSRHVEAEAVHGCDGCCVAIPKGEQQIRNLFGDRAGVAVEKPHARMGEHYGPYGTACIMTGQFDAGQCWKCRIKELEALVREYGKDYCFAGCIFGLNKHGKLHLVGDCRAPGSDACKARSKQSWPT